MHNKKNSRENLGDEKLISKANMTIELESNNYHDPLQQNWLVISSKTSYRKYKHPTNLGISYGTDSTEAAKARTAPCTEAIDWSELDFLH